MSFIWDLGFEVWDWDYFLFTLILSKIALLIGQLGYIWGKEMFCFF
jgi:hypothetical protein